MFHLSAAMHGDVVCGSNSSLALFGEDVLGTDQAKGKSQEMVSSKGAVESHKQAGVLVEDD